MTQGAKIIPYRGKNVGGKFRHLETFSLLFPDQIYNLVTFTRLKCPNELVSYISSKKDFVIRRLEH